jgi:bifunctional DNase/RNase
MEVVGVRVEMPTNNPIVLLKETDGERYLPIWIGPNEATAIAFAQQGMVPQRPLTHDLMRDVLEALEIRLTTVNITALRDGIFFADLIFSNGREVSARPSDSIALALRTRHRSSSARRSWTRPAWRSRTSRRTRSRSFASFSTRSHPRISESRPDLGLP